MHRRFDIECSEIKSPKIKRSEIKWFEIKWFEIKIGVSKNGKRSREELLEQNGELNLIDFEYIRFQWGGLIIWGLSVRRRAEKWSVLPRSSSRVLPELLAPRSAPPCRQATSLFTTKVVRRART